MQRRRLRLEELDQAAASKEPMALSVSIEFENAVGRRRGAGAFCGREGGGPDRRGASIKVVAAVTGRARNTVCKCARADGDDHAVHPKKKLPPAGLENTQEGAYPHGDLNPGPKTENLVS